VKEFIKKVGSIFLVIVIIILSSRSGEISIKAEKIKAQTQTQTFCTYSENMAVILQDGSLWMWGSNASGQLGNGTTTKHMMPIKVMDKVKAVSMDTHVAVIKTDGSLWMWGANLYGQLGDGTTKEKLKPIKVMDHVVKVSTGEGYTAVIKTDGSLWTWGDNKYNQLGNIETPGGNDMVTKPHKVMDDVVEVATGYEITAAIKADGSLWMWGINWNDSLGDGSMSYSSKPKKVMKDVTAVSIGSSSTFAIKEDGTLWAWGYNTSGQLGNGTYDHSYKPIKIMEKVKMVSAGAYHTAAIKTDGSLWTWGWNASGQLGNGSIDGYLDGVSTPVKVMEGVVAVNAGYYCTAALKADGSLAIFGNSHVNPEMKYPVVSIENVSLGGLTTKIDSEYKVDKNLKVFYNNQEIKSKQSPIIKNGQVLLPTKDLFQSMGISFQWNKTTKMITAAKGNISIILQTGFNYIVRNGIQSLLEVPPQVINGETYVPLKGVADAFGAFTDWKVEDQTISVETIDNSITKPYVKYEEKMATYGLDKLYNNKRANSAEPVTIIEALKVAIAIASNMNETSDFSDLDSNWIANALSWNIISDEMDSGTYNRRAKYIDVISYFEKCKQVFLTEEPVKNSEVALGDINGYTEDQQAAIKDMVANKIITPIADRLNGNEYISKGQLNELIVNFFEQYNTSTKEFGKIVTDTKNMPANRALYPYILSTIDKSTYEIPLSNASSKEFKGPKEFYLTWKPNYPQINEYCEAYFDAILNIDYRTITAESLKEKLKYIAFEPYEYCLNAYIDNVKKNKIIIEGSAKVQMPILYNDGSSDLVRIKVSFTVKSSKTKTNLLFSDYQDGLDKTYNKIKYDLIIDYPIGDMMGGTNKYVENYDIYRSICNKKFCGIVEEQEQ